MLLCVMTKLLVKPLQNQTFSCIGKGLNEGVQPFVLVETHEEHHCYFTYFEGYGWYLLIILGFWEAFNGTPMTSNKIEFFLHRFDGHEGERVRDFARVFVAQ